MHVMLLWYYYDTSDVLKPKVAIAPWLLLLISAQGSDYAYTGIYI